MEEFQKMVARVNASAFFLTDNEPAPTRRKKPKVMKKVEQLPQHHQDALYKLLSGDAVLVSHAGAQYVAWRCDGGWHMLSCHEEAEGPHTVAHGKCSCPQAKFRDPECKHILALRSAKL